MAIALVQQGKTGASNSNFASGGSVVLGANPASGNALVVIVRDYFQGSTPATATISSVTDTLGNTYSLAASYTATDPGLGIYVAQNITGGGADTVTVNVSTPMAGAGYWWIWVGEYSGVATTSVVDTSASGTNNGVASTALVSTAITTAGSGEAIILAGSQNNFTTYTAGTDFTLRDGSIGGGGNNFGGVEDYITTTSLSAYTAHFTASGTNQWTTAWVALKPAATGSFTLSAASGSLALTGFASTFKIAAVAGNGSFALTGEAATFLNSLNPGFGAFTLTGEPVTFNATGGYTLAAANGSFALTGGNSSFATALAAAMGAVAETGQPATFLLGTAMQANTGTFTLTPQVATFKTSLVSASGSFIETGQPATLATVRYAETVYAFIII